MERQLPRQHLIAHHSQAVDVRAAVDFTVSRGLLRAHVVRRPDRHARGGQCGRAGGRGEGLGDPEVRHYDAAPASLEQNVVRLHVPVDDAERVRRAERIGRLEHDAARLLRGQPAAPLQLRRHRLAVHVRHDEVDEPVGPFAHRMDRHDVGVGQPRRGLRLAQEPDADLLAKGKLGRQDLDRHLTLQALVPGLVDDPHAAATELPLDGVGASQRLDQASGERLVGVIHQGPASERRIDLAARGPPCNQPNDLHLRFDPLVSGAKLAARRPIAGG